MHFFDRNCSPKALNLLNVFLGRLDEKRTVSTDINHRVSKTIVNIPYDILALEDLTSIRVQSQKRKA
ncbi:hypothetical protein [Methanosarcina spelaei]|uniref:hypothetical protein n=1 Tax=Methanosarcina spelaei TaxID=1036679 RepID=UPI0011409C95|nr:hypothetical protein [Methanosarcina spelaei]